MYRKRDDYSTGSLVDYKFFKNHYQLITCNLNKQQELDPRSIKQIEFYGMLDTNSQVLTVLGKSKQTIIEFYKGSRKVL